MRCIPVLLFLFCGIALHAGVNLFSEDTSFETGTQNFRYYRSNFPIRQIRNDAAHGTSSLEIDSSESWAQGLWMYSLKKNTDYTVSFYARRVSGGNTFRFTMIDVASWKQFGGTTIRLTDRWQRYSCTFRCDNVNAGLYPAFLPLDSMVFRIDAIQLEQGRSASPYQAGEPFSVFPSVNGAGEVIHTPAIPEMTIHTGNAEISDDRQPLTLKLTIPGSGINREETFRLKQNETGILHFRFPELSAPGYYPAEIRIVDRQGRMVKQTAAPFVVTAPFAPPVRKSFFGMQDSSLPRSLLHRIGVSHLRIGIPGWKAFEPKQGSYRKTGIKLPEGFFLLPNINKDFTPGEVPAWGTKPDGKLADSEKAKPFLEHIFRSLKGKAEYLDFINEPDLSLRGIPRNAEYYAELLNTAAPIARKHGVKLMVDVSGVSSDFFADVLKHAHESIDICAPHPYCSPRIFAKDGRFCAPPEKGGFTTSLSRAAGLSRRYGKKLAIGELGYSLEETVPFNDPLAHRMAAYLARMFLIARTCPDCQYLIWFLGLDKWESGPYCYGIWRTANGIRPLPAVAAYAQAAHEIDLVDSAELILDSDIKIVRYKKNGQTAYAVWNAGEKNEPLRLDGLPAESRPRSIYGTPLNPAKVTITESPLYLSETHPDTVLASLRKSIDSRSPLTVRGHLRNRNTLKLHFFNRKFRDWSGSLSVPPHLTGKTLDIPRQSAESITVPLKTPPPATLQITLKGTDGRIFETAVSLPAMQKVHRLNVGDLRTFEFRKHPAWQDAIRQDTRDHIFPPDPSIPWSGPADLSHRTLIGWDSGHLYLFSEVRDDTHSNPFHGIGIWKGDSLQLGLDTFNDADGKLAYDSDDYEFTFAKDRKPWAHHAPPFRTSPAETDGIHSIITRDETAKTTTYRIAIPRAQLEPLKLRTGTVFGLALCINDADPSKPRRTMEFGSGISEVKCPGRFIKMILSE